MPTPRLRFSASLLVAGLTAAAPALATPSAISASRLSPLALSCQGCHQPAVNAASMPSLAGYSAARIAASLRAAREAPEPGSIMARFAKALTDTEIDALAAELGTSAAR